MSQTTDHTQVFKNSSKIKIQYIEMVTLQAFFTNLEFFFNFNSQNKTI